MMEMNASAWEEYEKHYKAGYEKGRADQKQEDLDEQFTMLNNSQKELKSLSLALAALDAWFDGHDKITTRFGEQYTVNGYQLESITFQKSWIMLSVFVLDRSVQKKDDVKMGDLVHFLYYPKKNKIRLHQW